MPSGAKLKQARIYRGTARNLARLARVLREGGLVAVPTETVYGLAGDALNAAACRKIFKAKGRPANFFTSDRSWGIIARQGPHQNPQKSRKTTLPR